MGVRKIMARLILHRSLYGDPFVARSERYLFGQSESPLLNSSPMTSGPYRQQRSGKPVAVKCRPRLSGIYFANGFRGPNSTHFGEIAR